jgi:uncharacterized protein YrzB (UPF0473 family)
MSMMEKFEEGQTVSLFDEDGQQHEFEMIHWMEIEESFYVFLAPLEEGGADETEAIVLRVEEDTEGNPQFVGIEDDDEWDMVSEVFETLMYEKEHGNDLL